MKLSDFESALEYLYSYIPKNQTQTYPGDLGLDRTKKFLKLLDNPQDKIKVIHLAGTSGKGSTAYLISLLLTNMGFKTGLALSPHLVDIRERVQINNALISKEQFVNYLNELVPAIEQVKPTYFEILTVLAFYIFFKEKVDYAVIETGLGGLYDATNTVNSPDKVAVLTKIGLDHTAILGDTLEKIAIQKAGIVHPGNMVISVEQEPEAQEVIQKFNPIWVSKGQDFNDVQVTEEVTTFTFHSDPVTLGMLGEHQAENASLALTVVELVTKSKPDYGVLKKANFPGRLEIKHLNGKKVIIDGAHNPQKMSSFLSSVKQIFPGKKFNFLVAFKTGKDYVEMLKLIKPLANKIFVTNFFITNQDLIHLSQPLEDVKETLEELNMEYELIEDNKQALEKALAEKENLIITGSLYLLAEVYPHV